MNSNQSRRLWIVTIAIALFSIVLVARLFKFQVLDRDILSDFSQAEYSVDYPPTRGTIYDRNGAVFAANSAEYQIGVSPNYVTEPTEAAEFLAPILEQEVYQLKAKLQTSRPYILLASRVPYEDAEKIREQDFKGLQIEPMPRRLYPQGKLMSQTLGIMDYNGEGQTGVEGYYNQELAGESVSQLRSYSPLVFVPVAHARPGVDLVLTIDRQVQFTVEEHLRRAMKSYEAESGSIIVMDPRTGAILAQASEPTFDPYFYYKGDPEVIHNPVVSKQFEPGSVIKLITMAAALDAGIVTPESTYYDNGELFVGGHKTVNWTREAHGTVDMTTLLAQSLNVGAATLALWMGSDMYYDYMQDFGFGRPTGIDLMWEAGGLMPLPGDPIWDESMLATNSYGQSLAVTPIQMIAAISALANDGKMMQPYIVQEIRGENDSFKTQPKVISQPISKFAAQQLTAMAVDALSTAMPQAQVPNYTVAGKSGTAQIAEHGVYLPDAVIATFVGYLPADDPEVVVYVKLDRPVIPWGSQTAAPTFSALARDLVVLLDIPPDNIRLDQDVLAARAAN